MPASASLRALLVFGLLFGVGYVVALPPVGWGDEAVHYLRALRVSRGQLVPTLHDGKRGAFVPPEIDRMLQGTGIAGVLWNVCKLRPAKLRELIERRPTTADAVFAPEYGAPYTPVSSVHTAAAVWLARRIEPAAPVTWFYAGRLANLAFWLVLAAAALWTAPAMHGTLLAILVSPTALFLGATFSADGVLVGLAVLWTALLLRLCARPEPSPSAATCACVVVLSILLVLVKLIYAPLLLLLLWVPASGRGARPRPWLALLAVAVTVPLGCVALWLALVPTPLRSPQFLPRPGAVYDAGRLLSEPVASLHALARTIAADAWSWLLQFAGPFWNECTSGKEVALPLVSAAVLVAMVLDARHFRPTALQRLVGLLVFAGTVCTVVLVALASWTPIAEERAMGVHSRYFLPALPALAVALMPPALPIGPRTERALRVVVLAALAASLVVVQVGFVARYDWTDPPSAPIRG